MEFGACETLTELFSSRLITEDFVEWLSLKWWSLVKRSVYRLFNNNAGSSPTFVTRQRVNNIRMSYHQIPATNTRMKGVYLLVRNDTMYHVTDMTWHDMTWHDMTLYMIWYDTIWCILSLLFLLNRFGPNFVSVLFVTFETENKNSSMSCFFCSLCIMS